MLSSVETLDGGKVELTVQVDESDLDEEIGRAFQRIGRDIRIPGFRPGKAPRRILEARLGSEAARAEALRSCIPEYFILAAERSDVEAIGSPDIRITSGQQSGPLNFVAVVQVRPEVAVSGYDGLRIEIPNPEVRDDEMDDEVDTMRYQFAEFSVVDRPAAEGDHLRIDISCICEGEPVDGLTASDYDYEIGLGSVVTELDENLVGSEAGDVVEFEAEHPDGQAEGNLHFEVTVKDVKKVILPDFDDEFVRANSESRTTEEFVATARKRRSDMKKLMAILARQSAMSAAIADLVQDEVPAAMVESAFERRAEAIQDKLVAEDLTFDDYVEASGQSQQELIGGWRADALQEVKLDLALRAVAAAEGLEPDDDEVDEAMRDRRLDISGRLESAAAERGLGGAMERRSKRLWKAGVAPEVRAALSKEAAMRWISERAVLIDPNGGIIDPRLLHPEPLTDLEPSEQPGQEDGDQGEGIHDDE